MIRPEPKQIPLNDIIKWAINGELGIPEFQRKFAWTRQDIEELLASILKGYYIGSFLFLMTDPEQPPFAYRPIQGTERLSSVRSGNKPKALVLDGQQRITSLVYALYAPDPNLITPKYTSKRYLFFLDLKKLENGNVDDAIFSYSEDDRRVRKYLNKKYQFEEKIIPFTLLKTKDEWYKWVDEFKSYQLEKIFEELEVRGTNNLGEKLKEELNKRMSELDRQVRIWNEYIDNIYNYLASVVYLPRIDPNDKKSLTQITLIFEKVNITGVKLSVFDLLNARLYLKGIRLHNLWDESVQNYENLRELSDDNPDLAKILVLRTIGLLRLLRADFDTKKTDINDIKNRSLINLSDKNFVEDWYTAVEYINKALERIMSTSSDGFGAFTTRWIPYKAMIPVFATFLYYIDNELGFTEKAYAMEVLRKWYWSSVFSERYSGSPENTSLEDLKELTKSVKEKKMPDLVERAKSYVKELNMKKVYSSSSAIYKGVMNLIVLNGARDFLYGESITFHKLEDHHIFPQSYLKNKLGIQDKVLINTILNRTLISRKTNNYIKDKAPSEYIRKIERVGDMRSILELHFIPTPCIEHMKNNDYFKFLDCREQVIKEHILRLLSYNA